MPIDVVYDDIDRYHRNCPYGPITYDGLPSHVRPAL
jgi:hypothetical protein